MQKSEVPPDERQMYRGWSSETDRGAMPAPPELPDPSDVYSEPGRTQVWRPIGGLTNALLVAASLYVVLQAASVATPSTVPPGQELDFLLRYGWLGMLGLGATVFLGVVGPMWMHRAYQNVAATGAQGLRWRPGWAAGSWFIPFANLVIPYQCMADIWRGSKARAAWTLHASFILWSLSWTFIWAGVFVGAWEGFQAGVEAARTGDDVVPPEPPAWLQYASVGFMVLALAPFILFVRAVRAAQEPSD